MQTMENKWEMLEQTSESREKIWSRNRTFAADVWFRLCRKPTAVAGLLMTVTGICISALEDSRQEALP